MRASSWCGGASRPPNACRIVCAARCASLQSHVPSNSASHGIDTAVERGEVELHDGLAGEQRLEIAEPGMIRADQHRHGACVARIDAMPRIGRDERGL